jgi:hypothetical protein
MKANLIAILFFIQAFTINAQTWDSVGTGINNGGPSAYPRVSSFAVYNNELIIGGGFNYAGGLSANGVVKWDGANWVSLNWPAATGVGALAVFDNELIVGGGFMTTGLLYIAKWDGTSWLDCGSLPRAVSALGVYNNSVYAGLQSNLSTTYIHQASECVWSSNNSGMDYSTRAFAVYNNELYAGGVFTTAGGDSVNHISKWDGAAWSAVGAGVNLAVLSLTVHNGDLYAGGIFTEAGGNPANNIAKWDGLNWSPLGLGTNSTVNALCSFNGELYAAGDFTMAGGNSANRAAKWDGINWSALGGGVDSTVSALCAYNNQLYVGGLFSNADGVPASRIARWTPEGIGINENGNKVEVAVFPNPFSAATTLTLTKEIKHALISVYTIQGKEVRNTKFSGKSVMLEKENLAGGVYFYKITSPNEVIATGKLVIQ